MFCLSLSPFTREYSVVDELCDVRAVGEVRLWVVDGCVVYASVSLFLDVCVCVCVCVCGPNREHTYTCLDHIRVRIRTGSAYLAQGMKEGFHYTQEQHYYSGVEDSELLYQSAPEVSQALRNAIALEQSIRTSLRYSSGLVNATSITIIAANAMFTGILSCRFFRWCFPSLCNSLRISYSVYSSHVQFSLSFGFLWRSFWACFPITQSTFTTF